MRIASFEDLTNILTWSKTAKWFHHAHDTFRFEPVVNTAATPTLLVPHALLRVLHEDLPEAICALLAWSLAHPARSFAFNSQVSATVDYYWGSLVGFTDTKGKMRLAKEFTVFQYVPNTQEELWLKATSYAYREATYNNKPVMFITDYEFLHMEARCRDLSEHYPGWGQRWAVAKELGLTTADTAVYVLSKKPVLFTALPPTFTFDEQ